MKQPWMLLGAGAFLMGAVALCAYLVAMLTNRTARRNVGVEFGLLPCAILLGSLHAVMQVPTRADHALTVVSMCLTLTWFLLWVRALRKRH